MGLSSTVSEINGEFRRKSENGNTHARYLVIRKLWV